MLKSIQWALFTFSFIFILGSPIGAALQKEVSLENGSEIISGTIEPTKEYTNSEFFFEGRSQTTVKMTILEDGKPHGSYDLENGMTATGDFLFQPGHKYSVQLCTVDGQPNGEATARICFKTLEEVKGEFRKALEQYRRHAAQKYAVNKRAAQKYEAHKHMAQRKGSCVIS